MKLRAKTDIDYIEAVRKGNLPAVRELLADGADLDAMDPTTGGNALALATLMEHWPVARHLIESGASADTPSSGGAFPLHFLVNAPAVADADDVIELLLKRGQNPDKTVSDSGVTALMMTANKRGAARLVTLLGHGARVDMADVSGRTALHYATTSEAVDALIAAEASVDALDTNGYTPLVEAIERGYDADCISRLIAHGASLDISCRDQQPAHYAAQRGRGQILALLLQAGANPLARNAAGQTIDDLWSASNPAPEEAAAYNAYRARKSMGFARNPLRP